MSGKNGGLKKKSGNLTRFEKRQILSVQIHKIFYFSKPSIGKKLIKNPLKSD